jgi:phosphodiesterase/alkaline phosphatase D-like protein
LNGRVLKAHSLLALVGLSLSLSLPAAALGAGGFTYGVAAGDVTSKSAILWTRADTSGRVVLRLMRGRRVVQRHNATANAANDDTVRVTVRHLRPGKRYTYQFAMGPATSAAGSFESAPRRGRRATIRFSFSGDADGSAAPGASRPFFNEFQAYARMAAERNDFNINLGDTIYSDSEIGRIPPALSVADKWARYRTNLALPNLPALRAQAGLYSQWDDHEFINDFSVPTFGKPLFDAGRQAFLDYAPVSYSRRYGLYRKFRWGRNVELFFLDERAFRDRAASADHACDNPTGPIAADLAPTVPQRLRNAFGFVVPALRNPPPRLCLERINDPKRTLLGKRQLRRFLRDVRRSRATFKVIVNETPIQQFYALPYDRWEGFAAERRRVIDYLRRRVQNVVFIATDTHANLVNDVRLRTLEPGGPKPSGMPEFVTGPVATYSFADEIDNALGISGAGNTVARLFFKPPPPAGVGMRCSALDVFSYAEVKVTRRTMTIAPKDLNGAPVREASGAPCGPFTVRARRR